MVIFTLSCVWMEVEVSKVIIGISFSDGDDSPKCVLNVLSGKLPFVFAATLK